MKIPKQFQLESKTPLATTLNNKKPNFYQDERLLNKLHRTMTIQHYTKFNIQE